MGRALFSDGIEILFEDLNRLQKLRERELHDLVLFELLQRQ